MQPLCTRVPAARPLALSRTLSLVLSLGSAATILALTSAAVAAPFTFNLTGTVTSASGVYAGVSPGDPVTGFYTVDDSLVADSVSSANQNIFFAGANPSAAFEISITAGTITKSSSENDNVPGTNHHALQMHDRNAFDQWALRAFRAGTSPGEDLISLVLQDRSPSPPDGILPGSGGLTGVPFLTPGDVSAYSFSREGRVSSYSDLGSPDGVLTFTIDSITAIPEPGTALLLGLGLAGLARRGARREGRRR